MREKEEQSKRKERELIIQIRVDEWKSKKNEEYIERKRKEKEKLMENIMMVSYSLKFVERIKG